MNTIELQNRRIETNRILRHNEPGLIAIIGPCAVHKSLRIVQEGKQLMQLGQNTLMPIHRIPPFKPRTAVAGKIPWSGLESKDPKGAKHMIRHERQRSINVGIEIASREHVSRYEKDLVFAWIGARSMSNEFLEQDIQSIEMLHIPLGIKNELTGDTQSALGRIERINRQRSCRVNRAAPAVLVFRGGNSLINPKQWEESFKEAMHTTEGRMIVDTAHGGEMAHDPDSKFQKTVYGQIACLDHVLDLADRQGLVPAGIMIEASDFEHSDPLRRTDPNMPFQTALDGAQELHRLGSKQYFN